MGSFDETFKHPVHFEPDGLGLSKDYERNVAIKSMAEELAEDNYHYPEEPEDLEPMIRDGLTESWVRFEPVPVGLELHRKKDFAWMIKLEKVPRSKPIWYWDPYK